MANRRKPTAAAARQRAAIRPAPSAGRASRPSTRSLRASSTDSSPSSRARRRRRSARLSALRSRATASSAPPRGARRGCSRSARCSSYSALRAAAAAAPVRGMIPISAARFCFSRSSSPACSYCALRCLRWSPLRCRRARAASYGGAAHSVCLFSTSHFHLRQKCAIVKSDDVSKTVYFGARTNE